MQISTTDEPQKPLTRSDDVETMWWLCIKGSIQIWKRCGGCALKVRFRYGNDVVVVLKLDDIESTIYH
nr:hypothetical protein [Tanacetum cinerariifolium]